MMKLGCIVALVTMAVLPAFAGDPGAPGTAIATGNCSRLVTGGKDRSAGCRGEIASRTLPDGTVFFIFSDAESMVAFSGDGRLARGRDRAAVLPIAFVAVGRVSSNSTMPAKGECVFGDPFKGKARIDCSAQTETGRFVGSFVTDGRQPAVHQ